MKYSSKFGKLQRDWKAALTKHRLLSDKDAKLLLSLRKLFVLILLIYVIPGSKSWRLEEEIGVG